MKLKNILYPYLKQKAQFMKIIFQTFLKNAILCFSGGFNSLAAYNLLENGICNYNIVSLDFGGIFSRGSEFFKRFSPHIVKTFSYYFLICSSIILFQYIGLEEMLNKFNDLQKYFCKVS